MRTLHSLTAALSSHRARLVLVLAVVVGLLALASAGYAIDITDITPSWSDVTGSSGAPDCLTTSATEVRFGTAAYGDPCPGAPSAEQSGLGFTAGANGVFTNGTPFILGELTHFNQQVFASSQLTSATLNLNIASTNPITPAISTVVTVMETANNLVTCPLGDTPPCADQISMTPSVISFKDGGNDYQIEILGLIPGSAGTCTFNPANLQLSLISEEDTSTTACLFGRVMSSNEAELEIEKSTTDTVLVPGEIVEYKIDYSCASTTASCLDVLLTDFLPPQLEYVSSTGSIHTVSPIGSHTPGSNTVLFDFMDPLPAGSTGFVTVLARVLDNGTLANGQMITNTATSTISNGQTNTTNTSTPVQTISEWDVQKSGDAVAYISTEPPITDMHYTVQICPDGSNVNLTNAQMVDTLPAGATFVSASGGGTFTAPNTVTWNLGELRAGDPCESRNVVVRFANPAPPAAPIFTVGQAVINNVNASGNPVGEPPWTDTADLLRVLQDFVPDPNMTLNKSTPRDDYVIGAQVDYALTPRNSGNTNLYNLVMTDNVPDQIRVTAIEVGGSAYPIGIEYELNGSGTYTTWPGSPFNSNTTLNVSALGLGANDWVTSVRWLFNPGGSTPPGWTLNPPARITGTITNPDRLGIAVENDDTIVNSATIDWEYLPGGAGDCSSPGAVCSSTDSPDVTIDVVPMPEPLFDKTSGGGVSADQRFIIGQDVGYFDLGVNNNTGIAVDNLVLVDDIPAPFNVTSVNVGSYNAWSGTIGLRYEASNNLGVWVDWPGTPFAEGATATAPALGSGVYISRIEFSYGTIPNGFRGAPRISGTTLAHRWDNGAEVLDGSAMTNNAEMSWTYQDAPSTRTDQTNNPIHRPTVTPVTDKTVTSTPPFIPTSAVSWRLAVGAAPNSPSNVMNNPIVTDLLPLNVNYVSYTYDANGTGLPAPVLTQIPNFQGTQTLLRWTFTGSLNRGQTAYIHLNTTLAAGTPAGTLRNDVRVTVTDMPVNGGVPDTDNWAGTGGTAANTVTDYVEIAISPLVGLDSHKSVRGELDSGFSSFPSYGQTVANGDVDYRLYIVNRGNVNINNVRVIDILPFVGDTGVRYLYPRNSEWRPVMTTPVTPQAGVTIYYSTSGNPCRPEVVTSGPPGCSAPNWSLVPPANIGDTQSLRFDFAGTLLPGESFTFEWSMRAPATATPGSIAWNSFAYSSTNADTGVPLFPAEPNKVGVVFNDTPVPMIDIEKHTNGFDADQPTGPLVPTNGVVTWEYFVTNTGQTRLDNVVVTDNVEGVITTCPYTVLEIGQTMTCTLEATPPLVEGQYANIGRVISRAVDINGDPIDGDPNTPGVQEITPEDEDPSHYFGYDPLLARLGDFTWIDLNANGVQDSGEPPIGGVTIHLLDSSDQPVDNPLLPGTQPYITTSDASGFYQFVNLPAGTYRVKFDVPFPYTLTLANQGANDALDSDPDPVTGITGDIVLLAGESDQTIDAGFVARAALGDRIWVDSNGNGIQDLGETATGLVVGELPVQLMADDGTTLIATTYPDAAGNYIFTDLPPGDYRVLFPVPPTGYLWTTPNVGGNDAVDSDVIPSTRLTAVTNLIAGEVDPTWDGGLVPAASLGDRVWYDNNFDGRQTAGEPGVHGVTVRLLDANGNQAMRDDGTTPIADVVTDASGQYSFTGLRPGVPYEVQFTRPANTIFTTRNAGSNDALDSDAIESGPDMGRTAQVTLNPGQNDTSWDAGLIQLASLGDFVWYDNNNNGQQDSGEPGVPGAIVTLLNASTKSPVTQDALGNPIGTNGSITTDSNGVYSFINLDPRISYIVEFQRPADTNFARPNIGNDATDSDAVPSGSLPLGIGRTGTITLSAGQNNMTIDAGVVPDSSLGDFVWYDNNNNGIQDDGVNSGVSGVTVQLLDSGGVNHALDERGNPIPDQVTDANGLYLFEHLRPGSYRVRFLPSTLPAGYTFAKTGQGTAATGSDPNRFTGRTGTISLNVNVDDMRWDAGIVTAAALGDFVWEDINADGLQGGPGELGVAGVTVRLLNSSNNPIDNPNTDTIGDAYTTTTDGNGYYHFTGLPPNETYRVRFVRPTGFIWTRGNQGADDIDSDGIVITVNSAHITTGDIMTLTPGSTDNNWDQGVLRPSALGDRVWRDDNDNGLQDSGVPGVPDEPGVPNVTVLLLYSDGTAVDDPTTDTIGDAYEATTDASGIYAFTNLYPGQYIVEFVLPGGYLRSEYNVGGGTNAAIDSDAQTSGPDIGRTPVITLPYFTTDNTWDAGLVPLASIGDFVWRDNNNNGLQDSGVPGVPDEPGVPNVTVRLLNADGTPVVLDAFGNTIAPRTTTTNANGAYSFTNLNPRLDYIVEFVRPAGYKASPQGEGLDDTVDSDADVVTGQTAVISLNPGQNDTTWDAGFTPLVRIGDFVWVDSNGNGQQDTGESGINGVTVTLRDGSGALVTKDGLGNTISPIQTVNHPVTGAPGYYQFADLDAGTYKVEFTLPSGYIFTHQNVGSDTSDSDADRFTGRTGEYTLNWGDSEQTVDAGIVQPASLGDYVWYDGNDNGIQDDGPNATVGAGLLGGMNGIRVELLDGAGNPVDIDLGAPGVQNSMVTADNGGYPGYYLFSNLIPGDYRVRFNLAGSNALPLGGTNNANYVIARQNQGANDARDSDPDRYTGITAIINLSAGENDLTNDAGILLRGARLGNRVWIDIDNNGVQDAGEAGINGVTVTLLNGSGGPDIDPIAPGVQTMSTTTAYNATYGDGWYEFTGLVPGTYMVQVTLPAGYQFSEQNAAAAPDNDSDSDVNISTGRTNVITMPENGNDPTWDAGLVPLASIGDFVWVDSNDNGIQDDGDNSGLNGVTVRLLDAAGNRVDNPNLPGTQDYILTTADHPVSGAPGWYHFVNLPPDTQYRVEFVRPNGYLFSTPNQGTNPAADSDADPMDGGRTVATLLSPGEDDLTWDAGLVPLAALGDFVWRDNNGDGVQDTGEPGLTGVTVTLRNATTGAQVMFDGNGNAIAPVVTTSSGAYSFTNLDPRIDYVVDFSLPAGYIRSPQYAAAGNAATDSNAAQSGPNPGRTGTIDLAPGETNDTIDAGYTPLSSLGDFIWNDINGNGVQDTGETGLAGATVTLLDGSGNPVATDALGNAISPVVTTSSGAYSFTNLPAGTYRVQVVPPTGYVLTLQDAAAATDATDSDVDRFTGQTDKIVLGWDEHNPTIDAGAFQPAQLGDFVWEDLNYNGQQDSGEPAVSGVTVRLLDTSFNAVDNPNTATVGDAYVLTTDGSGNYLFIGLFPGSYIVEFVAPTGTEFTQQNVGPDATDSDANPTTGRTGTYTLAANGSDLTVDAGIFKRASIGDRVWVDINNNGVQDAGVPGVPDEAGYPGATVTLYTGAGVQVGLPAITDASGNYLFDNLLPGDYYVVVTLPPGYQFSPQNAGSDDALDSDADPLTGQMPTTTLISGENDMTWDAGLVPLASLGDRVWNDVNGNGVQDTGETGASGVTVNLYRSGDTSPYRTTTTDSDGKYLFKDLPPGDYFVEFVLPPGMIFTRPNQGSDDTADSDADRFNGRTTVTTLSPGENDLTWDAGILQPAALGNYVWEDVNDNGQQDEPDSAGQNGVTVRLLDSNGNRVDNPNIAGTQDYIVTTADNGGNPGYYAFTGLFPGDYIVEFVLPAGDWAFARPNEGDDATDSDADRTNGRTAPTNLIAGETDDTLDAGLLQLASIGDRVWIDINNNGVQDAGVLGVPDEVGYPGATVTLYDSNDTMIGTTTTDASGNYLFDDLLPGDYYVVVTLPPGYQFSPTGQGTPSTDSDADPLTGRMPTTTLISGENDMTWDAGLVPLASLGDRVWNDQNGDGVQNTGEPGIPNVTVNLYRPGDTTPYRTTTTDSDGKYLFKDLPPGDYFLEFERPAGFTSSPQNAGSDSELDSDADVTTGRTITTTLAPGEEDKTWDAGFIAFGSIGDRVWFDVNGNGVQDPGEPGIPNVTVVLTYPDGSTATAITDADGYYLFKDLLAGTYTVSIEITTLPDYLMQTYDLDGVLDHQTTYTLDHGEDVRTLDFGYAPQVIYQTPTPPAPPVSTPAPTSTPAAPGVPGVPVIPGTDDPAVGAPVCSVGCPDFRLYHTNETGNWEIFRLNSADPQTRTTNRINLSLGNRPGADSMAPSLSPNHQYIVFTSNRATEPNQPDNWEIYVAPTSGGNPNAVQRVTWNTTANDTDPVWGPNNWVVFESNRNGNWDLYAVDMSTGIEYRLTENTADDINAFWSPDGSRLIYQSQRDGKWQVYEMNLATRSERRLSDGTSIDVDPVYSPDGLRIAFRSYAEADSDSVITLMNSDGSNRRAITSSDENATNQVWSPSGALIAYQSDLDGDLDIYVYDVMANTTRKVTDNTIPDYAPAWRCSDDIVLFTSDIDGNPNIFEEKARPISDPPVLVETHSDQLTFETFDDIYPQMSPSEENASREGQTPDGVFGEQTVFLNPQAVRIPPDLSVDNIRRDLWNPLNGCAR